MNKLTQSTVSNIVLLVIVFAISALFLWMIKPFLMTIFLAGIFSGVAYPIYKYFVGKCKQRVGLASASWSIIFCYINSFNDSNDSCSRASCRSQSVSDPMG